MNLSTILESTVRALLAPGKGLLAIDESFSTIEKRFKDFAIPSSEGNRHAYRELLCTSHGLNEFISGVILFDETIRQRTKDGLSIPEVLAIQHIVPGIKVDKGTVTLPNFPGEKITQGLDGLRDRLTEYRQLGARFTKWRAVIALGKHLPTRACIQANASNLALFAGLSQEAGLVPIVEPEILMDGPHTLADCEEATTKTLKCVFEAFFEHHVVLEHLLLKTNMTVPGVECSEQANLDEVATATLRCFRRSVPAAVPGIVFLSGGQSDEVATERLHVICAKHDPTWNLSFSFGRALQAPALKAWKGLASNIPPAQKMLLDRAQANHLAVLGLEAIKTADETP